MKKENCPFCGYRWTRSSKESEVMCPNCHSKYYSRDNQTERNMFNEEPLE